MVSERILRLILEQEKRGTAIQDTNRELQTLERTSGNSVSTLSRLQGAIVPVTAALGAAAIAAQQAWKIMGDATALQRTADQYERLAASIDTTGEALLTRMQEASAGMMTNGEIMASANEIISLGLANNEESVVRLSTVISKLGWDMSQVILTFANDSKMRLDALGLSVTDVEQRMEDLQKAGMSAGEAFDLAVIEAGEEKIRLLGDAADTAAGGMARLETKIKAVREQLLLGFGGYLEESYQAGVEIEKALALGLITGEQLLQAQTGLGGFMETVVARKLGVAELVAEYERLVQAAVDADRAMLGHMTPDDTGAAEGRRGFGGAEGRTAEARRLQRLSAASGWSMSGLIDWQAERDAMRKEAETLAAETARAFASAFQQSLSTEGGLDIEGMLFDKGVEMGLPADDLMKLGEAAGFAGDQLEQAAKDAAIWNEAVRLFGQIDTTDPLGLEKALAALDTFIAKMEGTWAAPQTIANQVRERTAPLLDGVIDITDQAFQETDATATNAMAALGALDSALGALDDVVVTPEVDSNILEEDAAARELRRYMIEELNGTTAIVTVRTVTEGEAIPNRARGGPVQRGRPYWVGEEGIPELFVPDVDGMVLPMSAVPAASGGGVWAPTFVNQQMQQFNVMTGWGPAEMIAYARAGASSMGSRAR